MSGHRKTGLLAILWLGYQPTWGGTGSPSDGFLSFILLFGFLLLLLGIMQLLAYLKRKIRELLEDL